MKSLEISFLCVQELTALLPDASPVVVLCVTDTLLSMLKLPKVEPGGPDLLDKRLRSILTKNPAVMNSLVQFALLNASETPASDLEFAATRVCPILVILWCGDKGFLETLSARSSPILPRGRSVEFSGL